MVTIKIVFVLLVTINLVYNINHKNEIKRKYILYINEEFDREMKIRNFAFEQQFTRPIEENKKRESLINKQNEKKDLSRGGNIQEEIFVLTFYTSLIEENSEAGPVTCNGSKLRDGIVANNILPQGTKIITKEFGELIVADTGGNNFNVRHRLDVFVPRNKGENNRQYKNRVNKMGIVKVKGYIIK
jgi:3D (Asp-Asp-Asp) domain-containing protein